MTPITRDSRSKTCLLMFKRHRQIPHPQVSYYRDRMVPTTRAAVADIDDLYCQYGPALLLFATAIIGERSRAQDAVHQVFLKLIEGGNLQRVTDKKAYLFTCVRNAVLNDARDFQRTVSLGPEAAWFSAQDRDSAAEMTLRRSLCSLPTEQRQIVVLHLWSELTFLEIAKILQISPNTAASRYRYALAKLREQLAGAASSRGDGPTSAKENCRA